jgi:hypothetical protein
VPTPHARARVRAAARRAPARRDERVMMVASSFADAVL